MLNCASFGVTLTLFLADESQASIKDTFLVKLLSMLKRKKSAVKKFWQIWSHRKKILTKGFNSLRMLHGGKKMFYNSPTWISLDAYWLMKMKTIFKLKKTQTFQNNRPVQTDAVSERLSRGK